MPDTLTKLGSYMLTAGVAAVVDAGGFMALLHAGLPAVLAATISFCMAAVVNYRLTARFVFNREASLQGFGLFLAGALGGLLINVGVTTFAISVGHFMPLLAKLSGIAVAFFANFMINLRFVFAVPHR